jgi:hypothetical protein
LLLGAYARFLKSFIMSYTYNNAVYSITSPVHSISVNKRNVVVTDKMGSKLFKFSNVSDSKRFLTWLYQT